MKIEIQLNETLVYSRNVVIDVEDEVVIGRVLSNAERGSNCVDDFIHKLSRMSDDVKIVDYPDDDLSSPDSVEIEIVDVRGV